MSSTANPPLPIVIAGLPEQAPLVETALLHSRIDRYVREYLDKTATSELDIRVHTAGAARREPDRVAAASNGVGSNGEHGDGEASLHQRAARYPAQPPSHGMELLVLPPQVDAHLQRALAALRLQTRLFDDWGLKAIEPFPRTALNLHGPPGTGKTLAAHGIASQLGKNILAASYADIESMYHGEAPKNIEALFWAAQQQQAVLFIDEADSLLSRRLTSVSQGSEQAANSVRSQLLICLERFQGVVIFATNLVGNYDPAFETRVEHIYFPAPNQQARRLIWQRHLPPALPLANNVDVEALAADSEGMAGREIKRAVLDAALRAAIEEAPALGQQHFVDAIRAQQSARKQVRQSGKDGLAGIGERVREELLAGHPAP